MRQQLSEIMREPDDGTAVVLRERSGRGRLLVWRDDEEAASRWPSAADEHWFDDYDNDPLCWDEITKYASAGTIVPATPNAEVKS